MSENTELHSERSDKNLGPRRYFKCNRCGLFFLAREHHLTLEEEKKRYDLHRNSPEDKNYVQFLNKLAEPLSRRLTQGATGLDFGSGPGPALGQMFGSRGFMVHEYDPFYSPQGHILKSKYDFIMLTEVAEHFRNPREGFLRIKGLLGPGPGYVGVMTELLERESEFKDWWYPRDPTHIVFYQKKTFEWIAGWLGWKMECPSKNVVIYRTRSKTALWGQVRLY